MPKKWTNYGDDIPECEHLPALGGWFGFENPEVGAAILGHSAGHRWEDYIEDLDPETVKCAESIRALVLERWPDSQPKGGFWHQGQTGEEETVPIVACGGKAEFSMRGWGDIIAAIISSRDDVDHSYVDFAWYSESEK